MKQKRIIISHKLRSNETWTICITKNGLMNINEMNMNNYYISMRIHNNEWPMKEICSDCSAVVFGDTKVRKN